jgi:hypothetical protein
MEVVRTEWLPGLDFGKSSGRFSFGLSRQLPP